MTQQQSLVENSGTENNANCQGSSINREMIEMLQYLKNPPSVRVQPAEGLIVNETGEAVLSCNFSANPPNVTEVTWYKDGKQMQPSAPLTISSPLNQKSSSSSSSGSTLFVPSPQLILRRVSRSDAGSYSCHVRNAFGRGNSSNAVTLDVL
ncbi:junctional adhesion molecule A-like, partial [Stegodyphus dumicola]|uniref:junctional adhesion molecule A-like n=1 Tax=Stegodyphus dumicola TaxID=202533 RepID=UPI0015B09E90